MLEEDDRVVAADGRPQQPGGVLRVGRERNADPRAVREDALAGLAVVRRPAAQIAADRDADHHRAREGVVRAIAQHRHLVAHLHHRRPDVVEELDLDDRLDAAGRHAGAAADDCRFGERRVEDAIVAERALQAVGDLEHAALARHAGQRLGPAAVGDVLAEDDDARVAGHLVLQRAVDRRHHRVRLAVGHRLGGEGDRGRIDVGRVDEQLDGVDRRLVGGEGAIRGLVDLTVDVGGDRLELGVAGDLRRRSAARRA